MVRADDEDDDAFGEASSDCTTCTSDNKSSDMLLSWSDDSDERGLGQQFRHMQGFGTLEVEIDEFIPEVCSEIKDGTSTRNNLGFRKTR